MVSPVETEAQLRDLETAQTRAESKRIKIKKQKGIDKLRSKISRLSCAFATVLCKLFDEALRSHI